MKRKKQIWLNLLSFNSKVRDDAFPAVFKVMATLITGYYMTCLIAFFCFSCSRCRQETVILLLIFLISMVAAGFLFFKRFRISALFFTVLLPLFVLAASYARPSIDFSTSILLVAILSLLVTGNATERMVKFVLHAAIYIFIHLRHDLLTADSSHQHLSLFNAGLLPFGCLFFILAFNRINKAFCFYREQHQLKKQYLAKANETLQTLLDKESKQKQVLNRTIAFKHQLISILSHDIRTPLYAYRMLIDGYEKKYYNEKELVNEFVNSKQELIKIDEMTTDLVKWARGEVTPQQKDGVSRWQLMTSLDSIRMVYAKSLKNKNITLDISTGIDDTELLNIGRRQLETIIRNLLSNAIKFSNEDSIVSISIARCAEDPSLALLSVKDQGVGMPARKLKELNRHCLVSTKGTADEAGLGIGLSLVFDIINRGELEYNVESKPGEGTCFKIRIPFKLS